MCRRSAVYFYTQENAVALGLHCGPVACDCGPVACDCGSVACDCGPVACDCGPNN